MKYLVLIGDGMSDLPLKKLGNKTVLEAAYTPNMDYIARQGVCGWTNNVPKGMHPGSDVAAMGIFGYDPKRFFTGRGPLEAASLGVKLKNNEVAFRCNLVATAERKMRDFTAGHIKTPEAKKIIKVLDKKIGCKCFRFYPGLSYRHLLIVNGNYFEKIKTTPPHDITGQKIEKYLPQGKGSSALIQLMNESEVLLHGMKTKATMIWPWGQGGAPTMPSFKNKYKKKAAIITAVHLLKGLGKILGMEVIDVPGATGYLDTNYLGKAKYALNALKRNDVVFVHVEAPDEAGHEGDMRKKIKAIEDFDKYVVGSILQKLRVTGSGLRVMVLPDHPTPIKYMTHTQDDVPFAIYPSRIASYGLRIAGYNEKEIKKSKIKFKNGYKLLANFLGGNL